MVSCKCSKCTIAKGIGCCKWTLALTWVSLTIFLMADSLSCSKFTDSTVPYPWDFWTKYDTRQLNIIYIESADEIEYDYDYDFNDDLIYDSDNINPDLSGIFGLDKTTAPSPNPSQSPTRSPGYDEHKVYEESLSEYVSSMNDILIFHELKIRLEAGDLYTRPQSAYYSQGKCKEVIKDCRDWANEFGRAYQSNKLWMCILPSHMLDDCAGKGKISGDVSIVGYLFPLPSDYARLTFFHELGHNFGAQHEDACYNEDSIPERSFNTIMTYESKCTDNPIAVPYFTDNNKQFCQNTTFNFNSWESFSEISEFEPTEECFDLGTGSNSNNRARIATHRINRIFWYSVFMPLYWISCFVVFFLFCNYIYQRFFAEKSDEYEIGKENSIEEQTEKEQPPIEGLTGGENMEGHTSDLQMSDFQIGEVA